MTREEWTEALGGVADRHVAAALRYDPDGASLREGDGKMGKQKHIKRMAVLALAAALVLALGATAYAAGWLDSIFGQAAVKLNTNDESEKRIEAAAAAVSEAPQESETKSLPTFDGSKLMLKESYYDGKGLLLGVDLAAARPEPVAGFQPDDELLARITQENQTYGVYYSTAEDLEQMRQYIEETSQGTEDYDDLMAQIDKQEALLEAGDPDDLDVRLDAGYITQEEYDDKMSRRTAHGAAAGLRYESAIMLDAFLEETLSAPEYEALWQVLERDGAACVVTRDVYLGDHMFVDGMDVAAMGTEVASGTFVEAQTKDGYTDQLSADLPEELQDLDELHIQLKVKGDPVYYYMTLDGRAYTLREQGEEQFVPFTIPNSAK